MKIKSIWGQHIFYTLVIILLTSSLSWGCGAPPSAAKGVLRIGSSVDGAFFGYPPKITSGDAFRQNAPAIETLLRSDKNGKLVPFLASDFKEDAAAKTITISLRKGVKFHDGTDLNAAAVKWNLDKSMANKAQGTDKFSQIDVVDDYTVRINLTQWDNTVTAYLSVYAGMMISPTAVQKNGEKWAETNPVGTGPFQFVSTVKDVKTVYKKFDGYWQKGKPHVDGVEWITIADPMTRQMSLKSKEIDICLNVEAPDRSNLIKDGFIVDRVTMSGGAANNPLVPSSATTNSPFANVKVRQAATHAIDSDAINKGVLLGEAIVTNQWMAPGTWAYNPSITGYKYDPNKAKQLLSEAGYQNGFKTTITVVAGLGRETQMTAIQGYLKAVGIDAAINVVQMTGYLPYAREGKAWEGILTGAVSPYPDPLAGIIARYVGINPGAYSQLLIPADYKQAIINATTAPTFDAKQKATWEAIKLMIDKYCLIMPTYCTTDATASWKYVKNSGWMTSAAYSSAQWTPEEAWLDK